MTTIVIVDDSYAVRALWYVMLNRIGGIRLIADCATVSAALATIRRTPPDILLLDLQLADGSGMEVMRAVAAEFPATKVVMVSNFADSVVREACTEAGAAAFFDKSHELCALTGFLKSLVAPSGPRQAAHAAGSHA